MWSGTRRKATSLSSLTIFSERLAPTFNARESIHRFQDYMSQYYYQVVEDFKFYLRKRLYGFEQTIIIYLKTIDFTCPVIKLLNCHQS